MGDGVEYVGRVMVGAVLVYLGIVGTAVYVIVHFFRKFW